MGSTGNRNHVGEDAQPSQRTSDGNAGCAGQPRRRHDRHSERARLACAMAPVRSASGLTARSRLNACGELVVILGHTVLPNEVRSTSGALPPVFLILAHHGVNNEVP